jgi:hypothetical protein
MHLYLYRLPAMWRDLLRTFFNIPMHYLYGGSTASYAAYGQSDFVNVDPSEAWPEDTKVIYVYIYMYLNTQMYVYIHLSTYIDEYLYKYVCVYICGGFI